VLLEFVYSCEPIFHVSWNKRRERVPMTFLAPAVLLLARAWSSYELGCVLICGRPARCKRFLKKIGA
jgi:hypothetical protein